MDDARISREQWETCLRYRTEPVGCMTGSKVGIARNAKTGQVPINGLRHKPYGDTCGWYIWAGDGDPLQHEEFFLPLHVEHLGEWCPQVIRFLALPPGWRFLVAGDYEDVWEDPSLLDGEPE